jgi:uracil-DNA glycosylase
MQEEVPYRRMRDPLFRRSQEEGLRLPHIAPINALVDELREEERGWVPYVAPLYGGIEAEMLSVLRDPGPMTNRANNGSGFLCLENDDPAAELLATLLAEAGIAPVKMTPWNAYPWYINRAPKAAELEAGMNPLRRLLALLPRLRVVMLHGGEAQSQWQKFTKASPASAARYVVLPTYHTSRQAFIGTSEVRAARMADLRAKFASAGRLLG